MVLAYNRINWVHSLKQIENVSKNWKKSNFVFPHHYWINCDFPAELEVWIEVEEYELRRYRMRIQSTRSGNSAPPSDDTSDINKFEWKKIILRLGVNQAV